MNFLKIIALYFFIIIVCYWIFTRKLSIGQWLMLIWGNHNWIGHKLKVYLQCWLGIYFNESHCLYNLHINRC